VVLVLRALALGDLLVAVPALRGIRRAFPCHRIVLATAGPLAALALLSGAVDEVRPASGLEPLSWDGPPPDIAVNLHGSGPQSHRLLDALHPVRRIGFAARGWSGPAWDDGEHEAIRWCRLLAEAGIPADPSDLLLPPAVGERHAVVIHPGAAYGCRRWPPSRYAEVARALARSGADVVVTGADTEIGLARSVAAAAGLPDGAVLAGRTDVLELAAVVASARLVICGDTGVAHLATAFATPSVVLFGPVSPRLWGPLTGGPHHVLWHPGRVRGDRWAADPDPALLAITANEVLAATDATTPARRG
jgi:ADP-heptose:LPS heptosyltransferase